MGQQSDHRWPGPSRSEVRGRNHQPVFIRAVRPAEVWTGTINVECRAGWQRPCFLLSLILIRGYRRRKIVGWEFNEREKCKTGGPRPLIRRRAGRGLHRASSGASRRQTASQMKGATMRLHDGRNWQSRPPTAVRRVSNDTRSRKPVPNLQIPPRTGRPRVLPPR